MVNWAFKLSWKFSWRKIIWVLRVFGARPAAFWYISLRLNVMAHAQEPEFVFRRNGRVHLNRRWASGQSTTSSRVVRISGSNTGYTMFRGSVKGTGYPIYSPVFSSLLPCVTVCCHISTGLYLKTHGRHAIWRALTLLLDGCVSCSDG
jgi:hypothetical protein